MGRIILDMRLLSELPDEATSAESADLLTIQKSGETKLRRMSPDVIKQPLPADLANEATSAASADWLTIQKNGENYLRRIRPLAAVPELPASKITSGAFGVDRIPSLPASKITSGTFPVALLPTIVDVGTPTTTTSATLTGSFSTQLSAVATASASTRVLVMVWWEGYATRTSGTDQFGVEVRVKRASTVISPTMFAMYQATGYGSASCTVGGSVTWWDVQTITSDTTFLVEARYITGTTSAGRTGARIQLFKLNV